ncbi:MAG: S8/S53 family peptidase [Anaerolineaceae bacterium]|nr:S8/S53 family peptidase [Anaerolineaceae bacterium]
MKKKYIVIPLLIVLILLALAIHPRSESAQRIPAPTSFVKFSNLNPLAPSQAAYPQGNLKIEKFQDVRFMDLRESTDVLDAIMMESLTFDQATVWPVQNEALAEQTLNLGMNPGMGVREVHQQGITGEGVNVAIIDQPLGLEHPEYLGKITKYYDVGTHTPLNQSSMHGPAVTSLLVGNNIGTGPGANVYFVAAPSWKADAQYYADALLWIIDENRKLSENEKIRVVSVSAAPSGEGSPFTKNNDAWDDSVKLAIEEGLLVLDCSNERRVFNPCYYDLHDPDNMETCEPGWPVDVDYRINRKLILIPTSRRTVAETYYEGNYYYQYTGVGGASWAPPYLAGVLALGWQINPLLSGDELMDMLFDTAYVRKDKLKVINPDAFVEVVKLTLN